MSVRSMTGFGTSARAWVTPEGPATVDVEVRSVNARFLELKIRQPFGAAVEQRLRQRLGKRLGRGRVDLTITVRRSEPTAPDAAAEDADRDPERASAFEGPLRALGIDPMRVDQALQAVAEVARRAPATLEVSPVNPSELLRLLVVASRPASSDAPAQSPEFVTALVDDAVGGLVEFREREGAALVEALGTLADELEAQVAALSATLPPESERLATKIRERLAELTARLSKDAAGSAAGGATPALDPDRVAQEVALVVTRGDVTEEVDRIASHLAQLRGVLAADASKGQGKTLEFVAQELFREITTIGSKITSHEGSRIVIEAKGTIERIREQVHNVE